MANAILTEAEREYAVRLAREMPAVIEMDSWASGSACPGRRSIGCGIGYFTVGAFRNTLRVASQSVGLAYPVSPYDFGTARAPSLEDVRALVRAMRHDVVPYRPTADRKRITRAFIRASVIAHTGARVGEVAMLEPEDLRLQERVVLMPTEKHRRNAGRMDRCEDPRALAADVHALRARER